MSGAVNSVILTCAIISHRESQEVAECLEHFHTAPQRQRYISTQLDWDKRTMTAV